MIKKNKKKKKGNIEKNIMKIFQENIFLIKYKHFE